MNLCIELQRNSLQPDTLRRNFVSYNAQKLDGPNFPNFPQASTESALREHFVLEQIAEEEKVDVESEDFESEIALIAQQEDSSPRRVRAQLEKQGQMDALRNQIIERKVIEMIVEDAKVTEEPVEKKAGEDSSEFAVYHNTLRTKDLDAIPEAKYDDTSPMDDDAKSEKKDDRGGEEE